MSLRCKNRYERAFELGHLLPHHFFLFNLCDFYRHSQIGPHNVSYGFFFLPIFGFAFSSHLVRLYPISECLIAYLMD